MHAKSQLFPCGGPGAAAAARPEKPFGDSTLAHRRGMGGKGTLTRGKHGRRGAADRRGSSNTQLAFSARRSLPVPECLSLRFKQPNSIPDTHASILQNTLFSKDRLIPLQFVQSPHLLFIFKLSRSLSPCRNFFFELFSFFYAKLIISLFPLHHKISSKNTTTR